MYEQDVLRLLLKDGWKVAKGPYHNVNLAKKGIHLWSIKTVLSKEEMKRRSMPIDKNCPAGTQRTVRFLGTVKDGVVVEIRRVTTTERKKLGHGRRKRAAPVAPEVLRR